MIVCRTEENESFNSIVWIHHEVGGEDTGAYGGSFNSIVWIRGLGVEVPQVCRELSIPLYGFFTSPRSLHPLVGATFQFHCMDSRGRRPFRSSGTSPFNSIVWIRVRVLQGRGPGSHSFQFHCMDSGLVGTLVNPNTYNFQFHCMDSNTEKGLVRWHGW